MFGSLVARRPGAGAAASTPGRPFRRPAPAPAARRRIATVRRLRWRSAPGILRLAALLVVLAVWALALRPQALGGPAAWVLVSGNSMQPTLQDGDLVLARRSPSYRHGDVIAYRIPDDDVGGGSMVIHRITGGDGRTGFVTRGDNRGRADMWRPTDGDVAGRLVVDVPAAGDVLRRLREPVSLAALAAIAAFLTVPAPRANARGA